MSLDSISMAYQGRIELTHLESVQSCDEVSKKQKMCRSIYSMLSHILSPNTNPVYREVELSDLENLQTSFSRLSAPLTVKNWCTSLLNAIEQSFNDPEVIAINELLEDLNTLIFESVGSPES